MKCQQAEDQPLWAVAQYRGYADDADRRNDAPKSPCSLHTALPILWITAGIRYIQENDYPVRGDYDVRDGIDWPRVFAATTSQDSMQQQQQQQR